MGSQFQKQGAWGGRPFASLHGTFSRSWPCVLAEKRTKSSGACPSQLCGRDRGSAAFSGFCHGVGLYCAQGFGTPVGASSRQSAAHAPQSTPRIEYGKYTIGEPEAQGASFPIADGDGEAGAPRAPGAGCFWPNVLSVCTRRTGMTAVVFHSTWRYHSTVLLIAFSPSGAP